MKNIFVSIQILLVVFLFASCDGPKKTSENQAVSPTSAASTDSAANGKGSADMSKTADNSQASPNHIDESLTGALLVENASNRLISKLNMTPQQEKDLKDILTKTFVGSGEDLTKIYTVEQARTIGRDIVVKSNDAIMAILDANQKEQFKRFGHK